MIIKSLSRKTASFKDLIAYFHKEHNPSAPSYQWNLYSQTEQGIVNEFSENAGWLTKRKNGVVLFHEIISLPENKTIPARRMGAILKDITHQYVQKRCPEQLVYGKMHMVGHPHFHLCISSNAPHRSRRHRLAKADLARIQKEVEAYVMSTYPELEIKPVYHRRFDNPRRDQIKRTRHEQERAKRTAEPSRKERDRTTLLSIFQASRTEASLRDQLTQAGFTIYVRGRTEGVIAQDGRKYRLKTLGLTHEYQTAKRRQKLYQERSAALKRSQSASDRNRER